MELAARIAGSDYAAAARLLVAVERSWRTAVQRPEETSSRVRFRPYVKQLRLSADHPFLSARGIHAATAQAFEAGWWPLSGFLEGCIGIRLHDVEGRPLGYAGRRVTVDTTRPWRKWKLPSALPKAELLFNWHRARCHVGHGVVVVEGAFDAMRVWQAGYPNVVALLGSTASARQRAVLAGIPRVVVVLDGDDAGRSGAQRLAAALSSVRVVELPNGHDPDDLSDDELHCSLAAHLPRPGSSERKRSSWPRTTKSEEVSM